MDAEIEQRGPENVMNNRVEVSKKDMPKLAQEIKTDPQVLEAGYCPE